MGFSPLELLVTMGIFTILSLMAATSLPVMKQSFDRKNARQQLEFDLRRAKNEAVSAGARGSLIFAADGKSYSFGIDISPYNNPAAADSVMFIRTLPTGITMTSNQAVLFNSRGYLIDINGALSTTTLILKENGTAFQSASVYPTGYSHYSNL